MRGCTAAAAATVSVVSALSVPPTTLTRSVWAPGVVFNGTVTVRRKEPVASAVVVPSRTGSLNSSACRGLPGGKPVPDTVVL